MRSNLSNHCINYFSGLNAGVCPLVHHPPSTLHTVHLPTKSTPENPNGDRNALGSPFQHGQFLYFRHPACHILRASLPEGPLVSPVTSVVAGSTKPARGLNRAPPFDQKHKHLCLPRLEARGSQPSRETIKQRNSACLVQKTADAFLSSIRSFNLEARKERAKVLQDAPEPRPIVDSRRQQRRAGVGGARRRQATEAARSLRQAAIEHFKAVPVVCGDVRWRVGDLRKPGTSCCLLRRGGEDVRVLLTRALVGHKQALLQPGIGTCKASPSGTRLDKVLTGGVVML